MKNKNYDEAAYAASYKLVTMNNFGELEKRIGYIFKNKFLLNEALTHTSYANDHKISKSRSKKNINDNERLEFLGDSVLHLVTTTFLFEKMKNTSEGELSRIRATIVCEKSLRIVADTISLNKYLLLGKGEELTGGRNRDSIISDAMEALIGAIYLDAGFETAKEFIEKNMKTLMNLGIQGKLFSDYKTQFQEIIQKNKDGKILYRVADEKGPDHQKLFTVELLLNEKVISVGVGRSKKEAEQNAAKGAIFEKRI